MKKDNQDAPMTIATIQAFRRMLDLMEEFIRNTEAEKLEEGKNIKNSEIKI